MVIMRRSTNNYGAANEHLVMPPSLPETNSSKSTETTFLVQSKSAKIIRPPWKKERSFQIPVIDSQDSTTVDSRDRYQVRLDEIDEKREEEDATTAPTTEDTLSDERDCRELQATKTVDSLELISLPPSEVRAKSKGKRIFSKIIKRKVSATPLVTPPTHFAQSKSIELILISLTRDKLTVEIMDGISKTKVQTSRPKPVVAKSRPKPSAAALRESTGKQAKVEENKQGERNKKIVLADTTNVQDKVKTDEAVQTHEEKQASNEQQNEEASTTSTVGPEDLPRTISYRTMPSITSYVFNEIPPAASIADMSDVSSSSSDASWSSSSSDEDNDDDDSFFASTPQQEGRVVVKKSHWNKKLAPVMKHLARPVVKASSPFMKALKNNRNVEHDDF